MQDQSAAQKDSGNRTTDLLTGVTPVPSNALPAENLRLTARGYIEGPAKEKVIGKMTIGIDLGDRRSHFCVLSD